MLNRYLILIFLLIFFPFCLCAQQNNTDSNFKDSIKLGDTLVLADSNGLADRLPLKDSTLLKGNLVNQYQTDLNRVLEGNAFLNSQGKAVNFVQNFKKQNNKEEIFYILSLIVLLFAILKFLYPRYLSNLFRVFFNTSLRQSQITDQLLQAKLPSMLYNLLFILMGAWYLFLLLQFYGKIEGHSKWYVLTICAAGLLSIYLGKFFILKFTGWITGYKQEVDTYIFIIFLINKILAICLMPLVIIMAFSDKQLVYISFLISFMIIVLMILMRFFRSYSLLQNSIKVSRIHFFIYIIGIEIIPLTVIYKLAMIFIGKNL